MGSGVFYVCSSCKKEYPLYLGYGGNYEKIYAEQYGKVIAGDYGEEWKELLLSDPELALDCHGELYCCTECETWINAYSLDLYRLEDEELFRLIQEYEGKQMFDVGGVRRQYVDCFELEEGGTFTKWRSYKHRCPKCGSEMKHADSGDPPALVCPWCGTLNKYKGWMIWD